MALRVTRLALRVTRLEADCAVAGGMESMTRARLDGKVLAPAEREAAALLAVVG
jgi:acetyl-CoA acetyltransferase